MPKEYSSINLGHVFNEKADDGADKCGKCGLVWRKMSKPPAITCPERPLDEVFQGWGERYGR